MSQADVVFFFGDSAERKSLYQLRQWLGPLSRLSEFVSVAVVCSSEQAERISIESDLKVLRGENLAGAIALARSLQPKVILYPNMFYENYPIWGEKSATHVFVSHGESDKSYMSQNAIKFFDYLFVAGDMAIERIKQNVLHFDESRCIKIGRPQLLDPIPSPPTEFTQGADNRKVILYAPTWEGSLIQNRYGSVKSHGRAIVESILKQSDSYRLIYKPHPFTGSMITSWGAANNEIKALVRSHSGGHLVDESAFGWQPAVADLMITDVSAVAYDWLATGKPIVLTKPAEPNAELFDGGIFGELPLLSAKQAASAADWVARNLGDKSAKKVIEAWSARYYEPAGIGRGRERFIVETVRLAQANKKVWPKTPVKAPTGTSLKKRIAKLLPLDLKLLISRSLELLLNGSVVKGKSIATFMTGAAPSPQFLGQLTASAKAKSTLLVFSPANMLRLKFAAIRDPKFAKAFKPHLVTTAQSVATAIANSGAKEVIYYSHCMNNHFGLRLNNLEHRLQVFASTPGFKDDHNLIAYDEVVHLGTTE